MMKQSRYRLVRASVALACAISTGATAEAAHSDMARVTVVEQAEAEWLLPTKRSGRFAWYAVSVRREEAADRKTVRARLLRGSCRMTRHNGAISRRCVGRRSVDTEAVTFNVATSGDARAVIRAGRSVHVVRWTAHERGLPEGAYWEQQACSSGPGGGGGFVRTTEARAKIFNQRLRAAPQRDSSYVAIGAAASLCEGGDAGRGAWAS